MTVDRETRPKVETLADAEFWIGVMHVRTCSDAERIFELQERVRRLERRRFWRRNP